MHDHRFLVDVTAWTSAAVAAVSLANAALAVSLVAGVISIVLGVLRLHDRLKYGPKI